MNVENANNSALIMEENRKSYALSKIVKYLDYGNDLNEAIGKILSIMGEYLENTNVGILCFSSEGDIELFNEWSKDEKSNIIDQAKADIWDYSFLRKKEVYVVSSSKNVDKKGFLFARYKITALLALPIMIYNKYQMVIVATDNTSNREWSDINIQFIKEAVSIIEGIVMRKMSSQFMHSSRMSLKEILDNMWNEIFVVDKETKEILFANNKMFNLYKTNMVGRKCSEFGLCGKTGNCKQCDILEKASKYWEYFDERFQKWFDVKVSEIPWMDGNKVALFNYTDITEKKKYEKRIEFQANNDFLTGLYNRMRCEADLYETITKAVNENTSGYVLFMDLDNFKHINDGLGHHHGDMLLKLISIGLQQIEDIAECCYRVGGDEFIILVQPEHKDKLERIIADIQHMFSKPWVINGTEYYSTVSMGIVCFPEDGTDVNDLIKKADIAMYDAKKAGRNRIEYYNAADEGVSLKRLDVEKNMRTAIAVGGMEFELYIQPIVDTITDECIGGEALIRWNSHELGLLMPMEFIPLAENLGLIVVIGEYFLRKACQINKSWSDRGIDKKLHVNLSIVQLVQNNIVETISSIIKDTGVNPGNIILEMTESLAINDMSNMKRVISEIQKLGVGIALDDFGTGYSSLNYIKQMNFDIIKVDKNFIDDITSDDYAQTFIKLITELSEKLGAKVCVEGVEDSEQLRILKTMNVNMVQGYYYGKPIPYRKFEEEFLKITE